jgi:hypothetical protein
MKGYRTPSWFRMIGFCSSKKEQPRSTKPRPLKVKETAKRPK